MYYYQRKQRKRSRTEHDFARSNPGFRQRFAYVGFPHRIFAIYPVRPISWTMEQQTRKETSDDTPDYWLHFVNFDKHGSEISRFTEGGVLVIW